MKVVKVWPLALTGMFFSHGVASAIHDPRAQSLLSCPEPLAEHGSRELHYVHWGDPSTPSTPFGGHPYGSRELHYVHWGNPSTPSTPFAPGEKRKRKNYIGSKNAPYIN
eukprot:1155649-Pelagomonas_calceolata.AAC.1